MTTYRRGYLSISFNVPVNVGHLQAFKRQIKGSHSELDRYRHINKTPLERLLCRRSRKVLTMCLVFGQRRLFDLLPSWCSSTRKEGEQN